MLERDVFKSSVLSHARHVDYVLKTIETGTEATKSLVAASWARSYNLHNLLPDDPQPEKYRSSTDMSARREKSGRLLRVADATLDQLFSLLSLAGCSVVLCDADGIILEDRSKGGDAVDFKNAGLCIGADWSEKTRGTNGIGTCLADGRRTTIHKDQHFLADNISMSCIGAPIFDTSGKLMAVLDVSTCRTQTDPVIQAMIEHAVSDAAYRIEANHFCDEFSSSRIIQTAPSGTRAPALLAVDACDLVVGATRSARRQFGLPIDTKIEPTLAADLVGDAQVRGKGLESAERRELVRTLARLGGNMSAAARELGVSRGTLYRRADKLGVRHNDSK